jgi:hypothetical protein
MMMVACDDGCLFVIARAHPPTRPPTPAPIPPRSQSPVHALSTVFVWCAPRAPCRGVLVSACCCSLRDDLLLRRSVCLLTGCLPHRTAPHRTAPHRTAPHRPHPATAHRRAQTLKKAHPTAHVVAGVRDPEHAKAKTLAGGNVTVVAADLGAPATLAAAVSGADTVFINTPGHIDRAQLATNGIHAAKAAGVRLCLVCAVCCMLAVCCVVSWTRRLPSQCVAMGLALACTPPPHPLPVDPSPRHTPFHPPTPHPTPPTTGRPHPMPHPPTTGRPHPTHYR